MTERTAALAASTPQLRKSERLPPGLRGRTDGLLGMERHARGSTGFGTRASAISSVLIRVRSCRRWIMCCPLINPEDFELLVQAFRKVSKHANTFQTEFRVRRPNGEVRWCTGTAAASFDDSGRLIWISGVTADVTERKRAEERQILLAEEVDHRARNVVAVVQSIMRLTRAENIDAYISALDGRIGALSNAHRLLARSRWEGADLKRLVEEEFAPYRAGGNERVSARGPIVLLPPATAQTIALALHELATNAAKYGALSNELGRVDLSWRTEPGKLELIWVETGGPEITPPTRRGYGSRAIVAGIERQLGGIVDFDWQAGGLRCTLTLPNDPENEYFETTFTATSRRRDNKIRCDKSGRQACPSCGRRTAGINDAGGHVVRFRTQGRRTLQPVQRRHTRRQKQQFPGGYSRREPGRGKNLCRRRHTDRSENPIRIRHRLWAR